MKPPRWGVYVASHTEVGPDLYELEHRTSEFTTDIRAWFERKAEIGWRLTISRAPNSRLFTFYGEAQGGMVTGVAIPTTSARKGSKGGHGHGTRAHAVGL